jgi:multiple sugar transport system substrate-binding protein
MKVSKWFVIVTVCTTMFALFAHAALAADAITLKVMNWSQEQAEFYKEAALEFQKEYPDITLKWETLAQKQYRESLPLMFQSGDAPDVFFWISQANRVLTTAELYDLGWIAPLKAEGDLPEDFLARWPKGAFLEGVNKIDGQIYSFPFNDNKIWGPGYMYINRSVMEAAGLDPDAAPTTWNELYETCKTIKDQAGAYCLAVPLKGNDLQRTWYPLAGSIMTDRFFGYKNGEHSIDDPKLIRAFNFLQKLQKEDLIVPGVNDKTFARQSMASGQAAIYFGGAWMPSVFKSMGFEDLDLGVAAPPVPDDGPVGALSQLPSENKYFVSSATEHPDAAWKFVEWMTRPEGFFAKEYLKRGFGPLAFADNAKYIEDPVMVKMAKEIAPTLRVAYPLPVVACPDAAKSKALTEAGNIRKNWEFQAMVEALTTGSDFAPVAQEIAAAKDQKFREVLEAEAAEGLDVSVDCFTFPEWEYNEDYDPANYSK